jgi:translation elongation factor EF-4
MQNPEPKSTQFLNAGQVGYIIVGMRTTSESKVGDTLFAANHEVAPFPGFKPARPMVRALLLCFISNHWFSVFILRCFAASAGLCRRFPHGIGRWL